MREIITTDKSPKAVGPYSQGINNSDVKSIFFVSGQIPLHPDGSGIVGSDIGSQTRQVMENLQAVVEAGGYSLADVSKCSCFLDNMADFADFNSVYNDFFASALPARECVEVGRLPKGVLVEVSAICIK